MSIREDLKAYVDGELTEARMAEIQAAIDADPALQQEVSLMRALGFEIKRMASEPKPAGAELVLKKVRQDRFRWLGRSARQRAFTVFAGCIILFCAFAVLKMNQPFAQDKSVAMAHEMERLKGDGGARTKSETQSQGMAPMASMPSVNGRAQADSQPTSGSGTTSDRGTDGDPSLKPKAEFGDVSGESNGAIAHGNGKMPVGGAGGFEGGRGAQTPDSNVHVDGVIAGTWANNGTDAAKKSDGSFSQRSGATSAARAEAQQKQAYSRPLSQRLIRDAQLEIEVDDARKSLDESQLLAKQLHGYSESSSLAGDKDSTPNGTITLRVPVDEFDSAMSQLRKMGDVIRDASNTRDVTADYADTSARLKEMQAEQESYTTMLKGAHHVSDLLEIKDRLSQVRQDIDSLAAQKEALKDQSAMSTISLLFHQKSKDKPLAKPVEKKGWANDTWNTAVSGLMEAVKFIGQVAIVLFVYSPVWLPIVILLWLGYKKLAKI